MDFIQTSTLFPAGTLEAVLRLVLSMVAGAIIGLERERRNQAAGLRTHTLIAVGSSILMIVSAAVAEGGFAGGAGVTVAIDRSGDPGRIAAQVVSGIGFIGAGTIMRFGGNVRGLTTAASIWIVAALGLAIGAGLYFISAAGVLIALVTLTLLNGLERRFFPDLSIKTLEVDTRESKMSTDQILVILNDHKMEVSNIDVSQAIQKRTVKMRFIVKTTDAIDLKALYKDLMGVENVYQVKFTQAT